MKTTLTTLLPLLAMLCLAPSMGRASAQLCRQIKQVHKLAKHHKLDLKSTKILLLKYCKAKGQQAHPKTCFALAYRLFEKTYGHSSTTLRMAKKACPKRKQMSRLCLQRAYPIFEKTYGHSSTTLRKTIAACTHTKGTSRICYKRAYWLFEKTYGHSTTTLRKAKEACPRRKQISRPCFQRAYRIFEKTYGHSTTTLRKTIAACTKAKRNKPKKRRNKKAP